MCETTIYATHYPEGRQIFADAFNYFLYGGNPTIQPEHLHPLDSLTTTLWWQKSMLPETENGLKFLTAMDDDTTTYMMLAIDKQNTHPNNEPIPNVLYDALNYEKQVWEIAAKHYTAKDSNINLQLKLER